VPVMQLKTFFSLVKRWRRDASRCSSEASHPTSMPRRQPRRLNSSREGPKILSNFCRSRVVDRIQVSVHDSRKKMYKKRNDGCSFSTRLRREWPEASGSLARLFTTGYPLPGTAQPHNYRYP
jgi:hypothetical protein